MLFTRAPFARLLPIVFLLAGAMSVDIFAQAVEGVKFEDYNRNGIQDAGEPGLANWIINAYNTGSGVSTTATTDFNGNYSFPALGAGTWLIHETQQNGWVQTAPATVRYSIVVGGMMPLLNFGNVEACESPATRTITAGVQDNFATGNREEMSPSAELLGAVTYSPTNNVFDNPTTNSAFAHTFTGIVPAGCYVVGARLTMRIRALSSDPSNDAFRIVSDGTTVWRGAVSNLVGYTWTSGSTHLLTLDLADLPDDGDGITNVLAALQDGDLDIWGQDDTSVDFMVLAVDYCCDGPTGLKFNDLNHNKIRNAGEPGLTGWTINAYNTSTGQITSATTDAFGTYVLPALGNGTWIVYETQQTGWAQTAPPTVGHTIVIPGDNGATGLDFGNTAECDGPTIRLTQAGMADNFATGNNEPMSPSAELLSAVTYTPTNNVFDNTIIDRSFAHTFTNIVPAGCYVVGATLTMRIRALNTSGASNDAFRIVSDGVNIWRGGVSDLVGYTWTPGSTELLVLDLANLPADASGITNVLAALQDGDFDVWGQDDTSVDFMRLEVRYCCSGDTPQPKQGTGDAGDGSSSSAVPNPFSDHTDLVFSLPADAPARVVIYDIFGNTLRTFDLGTCAAGTHTVRWDGRNALGAPANNGVYFYQVEAVGFRHSGKLMLQR